MSAADLAAVNALSKAASDMQNKGHFARAAVKFGAAVAAAQALGHADCLVTAMLQVEAADTWINHAFAPGVTEADTQAAFVRALQLLDAAAPTLERRRAAGTLRTGACRPLEEAWFAAKLNLARLRREQREEREWLVPLIGYELCLLAAHVALRFAIAMVLEMGAPDKAQRLVTIAVSAVDMLI
jgi:hypothetical protein